MEDDDGGGAFWLIPPLFGCMLECKYDGMTTELLRMRKAFFMAFFLIQGEWIGSDGLGWIGRFVCIFAISME